MKLYCATTNRGKIREFQKAFETFAPGEIELAELPCVTEVEAPQETGKSFEENAIQKARHYSRHSPRLLFCEDSGIEVDALGGGPGVQSARFAGPDATDEVNNRLLLEKLVSARDRSARYVCVIAAVEGSELAHVSRGFCEGEITKAPKGSNGFGYDPLFYSRELGKTFGESSPDEKLGVSHRGRAVAELIQWLRSSGRL